MLLQNTAIHILLSLRVVLKARRMSVAIVGSRTLLDAILSCIASAKKKITKSGGGNGNAFPRNLLSPRYSEPCSPAHGVCSFRTTRRGSRDVLPCRRVGRESGATASILLAYSTRCTLLPAFMAPFSMACFWPLGTALFFFIAHPVSLEPRCFLSRILYRCHTNALGFPRLVAHRGVSPTKFAPLVCGCVWVHVARLYG